MNRTKVTFALMVALSLVFIGQLRADDKNGKEDDKQDFAPTHVQVGTIDACKGEASMGLNAFCLDSSGNILCAVGKSVSNYGRSKNNVDVKQGIRVFNPDGEMTAFWPLDFTPQAIGFGPDSHIYVGGEGKIARLNRNGDVVKQTDAPNIQNREEMVAAMKKELVQRAKQMATTYNRLIKQTKKRLADQEELIEGMKKSPADFVEQLKKSAEQEIQTLQAQAARYQTTLERFQKLIENANEKQKAAYENTISNYERLLKNLKTRIEAKRKSTEISADDDDFKKRMKREILRAEMMAKSLKRTLKTYQTYLENNTEPKVTEEQIEAMLSQKSKVSSISASGDHVFVVCQAMEGYGFDVWKTDHEFTQPEKIVKGLRGCCGQMDVQACQNGLFVAENTGHRVAHYDLNGKQLGTFGKRDAKGEDGFGSCCNPMNVCFAKGNTVLTSESGTGRIMQFNQKGKKLAVIGNGEITGGCKNVAIHATHDLKTVYMLDLTGKKICILKPKQDTAEQE